MGLFWWKKKVNEVVFKKQKKVKLGLVLSGGATRGIGHIGVIKAFEKLGVEFDVVVGTSAGSFVGALYSYGWTSADMENALKTISAKDIKGGKISFLPSSTNTFIQTIEKLMGGQKVFSDLKKKFIAVATNLKTGKEVWIESGSVAKAIACSCAVPGVFKPVHWDDKLLCDGGLVNNVPVNVCKYLGADIVVAVDVNVTRGDGKPVIKGIGDVLSSTIGIMLKSNAKSYIQFADVMISPNLKDFKSAKLDNAELMIAEGEKAVLDKKDEIIKVLNQKKRKNQENWKSEDVEQI